MDISSVGSFSIQASLASTQHLGSIAVMKKAMDFQETQAAALVDSLQAAVPSSGHVLDMYI